MERLKRKKVRAYILLEALLSLAIFALIAGICLDNVESSRRQEQVLLEKEEKLRLFDMALYSQQSSLDLNGQRIEVEKTASSIRFSDQNGDIFYVQKQ